MSSSSCIHAVEYATTTVIGLDWLSAITNILICGTLTAIFNSNDQFRHKLKNLLNICCSTHKTHQCRCAKKDRFLLCGRGPTKETTSVNEILSDVEKHDSILGNEMMKLKFVRFRSPNCPFLEIVQISWSMVIGRFQWKYMWCHWNFWNVVREAWSYHFWFITGLQKSGLICAVFIKMDRFRTNSKSKTRP